MSINRKEKCLGQKKADPQISTFIDLAHSSCPTSPVPKPVLPISANATIIYLCRGWKPRVIINCFALPPKTHSY